MVNKQEYLNAVEQNIEMVRGDTLAFNFQLGGLTQAECEALTVTFAVTNDYEEDALFEITNGTGIELIDYVDGIATYSVAVSPTITTDMEVSRYYYDLQIEDADNKVTLMRGSFTLLYEVKGV